MRHACHAKRRLMWASATHAMQHEGRCRQVPRLPHKVPRAPRATNGAQARHQIQSSVISATPATENPRSRSPSAPPATQRAAAPRATNGAQARHQIQSSVISATPATQNEGWFEQLHACHATRRSMSPSATPATESAMAPAPGLPRRHGRPRGSKRATRASPVP